MRPRLIGEARSFSWFWLEFSMFPLDKGESVSKYVARSIDIIDRSGLAYQTHAMGTVIEGEFDQALDVVRRCYEAMAADCDRIECSIKIDARKGAVRSLAVQGGQRRAKVGPCDQEITWRVMMSSHAHGTAESTASKKCGPNRTNSAIPGHCLRQLLRQCLPVPVHDPRKPCSAAAPRFPKVPDGRLVFLLIVARHFLHLVLDEKDHSVD